MSDVFDDLVKAFRKGYDLGKNEAKRKNATRDALIHDLCRALERAQEIIVMIGEKSGNEELLAEAKVYANAVGSLNDEFGPKPVTQYFENPIIQKYWERISARARGENDPSA